MANVPYYIEDEEGNIYKGVSDQLGKLQRVSTKGKGQYTLLLGVKALEKWWLFYGIRTRNWDQ